MFLDVFDVSSPYSDVEVKPVALFSILDHHLRRPKGQEKIIGTLMGSTDGDRVLITSAFGVPHTENDQVHCL